MLLLMSSGVDAQQAAMITGRVTDEKGQAVELVNVSISGYAGGTTTAADGSYSLQIPAAREVRVLFSFIGYKTDKYYLSALQPINVVYRLYNL